MEPVTAMPATTCPVETQRSISGLILKLFVVHFVTLSFFFHCYHQRQGQYLNPDAIIFLASPLNTVVRYAVALLAILGYLCCKLLYSASADDQQRYRRQAIREASRALSALLGRSRGAGIPTYFPTHDTAYNPTRSERVAARIGPVIPALAFITQCCGAIYLYHRRRQFKGVTLIDQQIFETACAGLVIGLLSAGYTLDLPFFNDAIPDTRDTYLEHAIHILRDQGDDNAFYTGERKDMRPFIFFGKAFALTMIIQLLARNPALDFAYGYMAVLSALIFIWHLARACWDPRRFLRMDAVAGAPVPRRVLHAGVTFCIYCFGTIGLAVGAVLPFCGGLWLFWAVVRIAVEAGTLENGPVDGPCPLLRMDPVAEYIWWLG